MALALEDLGFVVWEAQVVASTVDVEGSAEAVEAHRGALDVPTGSALAPWRRPRGLARLRRFPEGEIAVVALAAARAVNPSTRTGAHGIEALPSQLTVFLWGGGDVEVHAVVGRIGVAALDQILNDADHAVDVFRAAGVMVGTQDVQRVHVLVVAFDHLVDQTEPVAVACFVGPSDDFVVNVGEILDVIDVVPAGFQPPVNQVEREVTPGVPEVAAVVDRYTTDVHAHPSRAHGGERHLLSTTGVVDTQRHGARRLLRAGPLQRSCRAGQAQGHGRTRARHRSERLPRQSPRA